MASFKKHGDKNWEYRLRYKDPISGKYKEKAQRGFATKPEARLAAEEMEKRIKDGYEESENVLLKNYLSDWLATWKTPPKVRKNTHQLHKRNIEKHIIPYFKEIKVGEITHKMHQEFLDHLSNQDYSKRTIEIIHGTMFSALEKAVNEQRLKRNPCLGAEINSKKKVKNKEKLEYMDSEDIPLFLQQAYQYDYIYWLFFKVLLETGMRKGEAAALQWSDVDLKEGTITINKTLDFQAKTDEELFGDPKTFTSKRTITVRKSLINDLSFHKNYQNQNKLALNEIYKHELNLVLCRNDGNFMPKSTLFNAMERILKRAGLPQIPIHALRDSHAVLLLESGASLEYVQRRLGHKSYQTTADIYSHISKKIEQDTLDKYEAHMDSVLK